MDTGRNEQTKTTLAHFSNEIDVWFADRFAPPIWNYKLGLRMVSQIKTTKTLPLDYDDYAGTMLTPSRSSWHLKPKPWSASPTVYPKNYAHGFVVLCFVVVMQSFVMNLHQVFIHIHQGCFAGTGAIVRLPQCQWSKPGGYGKISQCITTTKHSKEKSVCIFLGIYCIPHPHKRCS